MQELGVMQCSVRHPVLAVSTLDGATPPDSHGRQLIIQHGRIFRSLSPPASPACCPLSTGCGLSHRQPGTPSGGPVDWAQALGHIMTAVTDPQIAGHRHNNVSIGAQNGDVALNMDIVLHSSVQCVEFFQIWTLDRNEIPFLHYQTLFIINTVFDDHHH